MDKFYNEILSKLETAINELEIEADCSIQRVEAVIHLVLESLSNPKYFDMVFHCPIVTIF